MIRRDTHSPSLAARVSNGGGATVKPRMPLPARSEAAPAAMLAALLVLGACLLGGLPAEAVPAASCSASDKQRYLSCDLGLELWEEGKKSESIFQRWHLTCSAGGAHQTWCTLERTLITLWSEPVGGLVTIHRHATSDGSLKVWSLDWTNWTVSFDVVYPGGERMPVLIRLKPMLKGFSGFLAIESFQAKDVVRTLLSKAVVSQEWRIPEYSYPLNVPISLLGRKRADEKEGDDLLKRLSPTDRQAFERIRSAGGTGCLDLETSFNQQPLRMLLRPYEARAEELERQQLKGLKELEESGESRTLSEAQEELRRITREVFQNEEVKRFLHDKIRRCLTEAGMSKEGAELIASFSLRGLEQVR